jgi:hypothetical protein
MIEIKKIGSGFFTAYVNGTDAGYTIILANGYGCGKGGYYYNIYKGDKRLNNPMIRLSLHSAKQKVMADILKNS